MTRIDVFFLISVKLKVNFLHPTHKSHSLFLQEHKLISDGVTK